MVEAMAILRIPALIDPHFHMIESTADHWRDVARIAQRAGYWGIQVMPDLDPPIIDKLSLAHYTPQLPSIDTALFLTVAGTPKKYRGPQASSES